MGAPRQNGSPPHIAHRTPSHWATRNQRRGVSVGSPAPAGALSDTDNIAHSALPTAAFMLRLRGMARISSRSSGGFRSRDTLCLAVSGQSGHPAYLSPPSPSVQSRHAPEDPAPGQPLLRTQARHGFARPEAKHPQNEGVVVSV